MKLAAILLAIVFAVAGVWRLTIPSLQESHNAEIRQELDAIASDLRNNRVTDFSATSESIRESRSSLQTGRTSLERTRRFLNFTLVVTGAVLAFSLVSSKAKSK